MSKIKQMMEERDAANAVPYTSEVRVAFACGENGEFGLHDGLPWGQPLPEDMKHFRAFTKDTVLVMGAKTFESLPCKLPNRKHIVLSSRKTVYAKNGDTPDLCYPLDDKFPLAQWLRSLGEWHRKPICVIGGKNLIEEALPFADKVYHCQITQLCTSLHHYPMDCTVKFDGGADWGFGKLMELNSCVRAKHINYDYICRLWSK